MTHGWILNFIINAEWEKFFKDNPSYTIEQVMEYAQKLMTEIYGQ